MPGREAAAPGQPWLMDLELWVQGRGPAAQGITREARCWLGAWGRSRGRSGGCGRPRQCPQPPAPAHPQGLRGLAALNPASPPPGSRALIKLYQAERTSKHCFVAMATRETRATWSISEESPYYREFKGKVLKNAERLGRVIRLGALRANATSHEALPERLAWLRKHRDTRHNGTSNPGGDGADRSGCPGTQPLLPAPILSVPALTALPARPYTTWAAWEQEARPPQPQKRCGSQPENCLQLWEHRYTGPGQEELCLCPSYALLAASRLWVQAVSSGGRVFDVGSQNASS